MFISILLASFETTNNAFAMGPGPGSCTNEYDGSIIDATITFENQTYYPLKNNVTFQIPNNQTYHLTFTLHTPNQNSLGNSDPGTVWLDTDVNGYHQGACAGNGIGPNQNYTESDDIGHSGGLDPESSQTVTWYTLVNQFSYTLDWLCTSTTVPCKATNLSTTPVSSSQINLNWTAPSNEGGSPVTGYEIDRTVIDPDGVYRHPIVPIVSNTNSTVTAYSDTGLSQNTQYAYWVRAINSFGISRSSDGSHTTTLGEATTPSPPTGLETTSISSTQISLSWTAPTNNGGSSITNYNVYRGTSSGSETLLAQVGNDNSYTDGTVTAGQTYFYTVTSVNSAGESIPSNEVSATPIGPPQPPTGLTATGALLKINLSWNAPSNDGGSAITGYLIERSSDNGNTWSTLVANTNSTGTTYSDTNVLPLVTYSYYVYAINDVGTSNPSNIVSATTTSVTPPSPTGIVLNNIQSTSGTVSASNQMTLTNFDSGTGNNKLLVVGVGADNSDVNSITFNGMSLTRKAGSFYNNDAEFWYLKNPSGTGDVVVTMNGQTSAVVGAYSFSGVNQTTPLPSSTTKHNTTPNSPNITITTKFANDWVLDLPSIYGGSILDSPSCTQQWETNVPDAITGASSSKVAPTPGAVTCKWAASSGDLWDDAAIEIKASK